MGAATAPGLVIEIGVGEIIEIGVKLKLWGMCRVRAWPQPVTPVQILALVAAWCGAQDISQLHYYITLAVDDLEFNVAFNGTG